MKFNHRWQVSGAHRRCGLARAGVAVIASAALALVGCASTATQHADELNQAGRSEEALQVLADASGKNPSSVELRSAAAKQREATILQLLYLGGSARSHGDAAEVERIEHRLEAIAAGDPRVDGLRDSIERDKHVHSLLADADKAWAAGRPAEAESAWRNARTIDPANAAARDGLARVSARRAEAAQDNMLPRLAPSDRLVDIEFHDAPLRVVLDTLARQGGLNFAFDKDVHTDVKVNVTLRKMHFIDALSIVLQTQDLQYKAIDARTVLVYQNSQQKQHEFQELVTRTFYLVNANPKETEALVKSIAKARDVYVDERLAMLVVHDSPEVIQLVEKLIDAIDLPEPEVMLEVSVLEVSSAKVSELGLSLPPSVAFGLPTAATIVTPADRHSVTALIANPLLIASLTSDVTNTNVLANPKIRARNHEKAHIQVGDRLPVFTSTSTANVGVSSTVNYLDVGLKLDLEPQVQLDNEVTIKVSLEVSSAGAAVSSADRQSTAYPVNTRQATTSLRLRDGETEILAGLINDSEIRETIGVPVASEAPILGLLFGDHKANNHKTEVVLLVTPHVIRNLPLPLDVGSAMRSGTETHPGFTDTVFASRSGASAKALASARVPAADADTAVEALPVGAAPQDAAAAGSGPGVLLRGPEEVNRGGNFQVLIKSIDGSGGRQDVEFDPKVLRSENGAAPAQPFDVDVPAAGERPIQFRVLDTAAAGVTRVRVGAAVFSIRVMTPGQP